jgi:3-hydroxyacyl-[acyl-carrier-protein] dehydratase
MRAAARTVTANFAVPRSHAALPGHFPGDPVVPGVLVLDHVIQVLEASCASLPPLRKLKQVKFIEPLLPGQEATVTADVGDATVSFSVTRSGCTIARGVFEIGNETSQ